MLLLPFHLVLLASLAAASVVGLEAFIINLDKSKERMIAIGSVMDNMKISYHRIRAYTVDDIIFPVDVLQYLNNRTSPCAIESNVSVTCEPRYPIYVKRVCGSTLNTFVELACTASHLHAIHSAVYSRHRHDKYALILEDDGWSPFDINFTDLIRSAPDPNFGILQLVNSKAETAKEMASEFLRTGILWKERSTAVTHGLSTYSTGAYIINKITMQPIIDKLLQEETTSKCFAIRAVAASVTNRGTCKPSYCCDSSGIFQTSRCIYAPMGYQADSIIYASTKTFVSTIPLFLDGVGSENSSIHQDKAKKHEMHFKQLRQIVQDVIVSNHLPTWLKPTFNKTLTRLCQ